VSYGATALLLHVCEEGHEGYKTIDVWQPISGSLSNVHIVSRLAVEVKVDGEEEHTEHKFDLVVNNSQMVHTDFCDEQSRG